MPVSVDPVQVKKESERIITEAGGRVCDWLPHLDRTEVRGREGIVGRALVMNALVNIYFKAPTAVIRSWIEGHGLEQHLSSREKEILAKSNEDLEEQELIDLYWYLEALWALLWVGSLIDEMPFDCPVADFMASLCPNLQVGEDGSKFSEGMVIRDENDVFRMLDLHFRLHWWTRDGQLNGYQTGDVSLDIIMERRKALEWVMDSSLDWDDVPLNT